MVRGFVDDTTATMRHRRRQHETHWECDGGPLLTRCEATYVYCEVHRHRKLCGKKVRNWMFVRRMGSANLIDLINYFSAANSYRQDGIA